MNFYVITPWTRSKKDDKFFPPKKMVKSEKMEYFFKFFIFFNKTFKIARRGNKKYILVQKNPKFINKWSNFVI